MDNESHDYNDDDLDEDKLDALDEAELDALDALEDPDRPLAPGERTGLPPELEALFDAVNLVPLLRFGDPKAPGVSFNGFEAIGAKLGGLGIVLEAHDPRLDRKVAIKLWNKSGAAAQAKLIAEAKTLARMSHPNVITVYEAGRWREWAYFVMEWVDGMNGHEWISREPDWQAVREVFLAAGKGLAAAHDRGIQHRDFKPANILIGKDGRVLVADFGLADLLWPSETVDGELVKVLGTSGYMAPERLCGGHGDHRSDLFSFCVSMWEALYGMRPYPGSTPEELLTAITGHRVLYPSDVEVPEVLKMIVTQGLLEQPSERWRDMHELVKMLTTMRMPRAQRGIGGAGSGPGGDHRLLNSPAVAAAIGASGDEPDASPRGPTSGLLLGAMTLTGVLVFGAVAGGILLERSGRDEPMAQQVIPVDPEPCELNDDDPRPVDPDVIEVCWLIRSGDVRGANELWSALADERGEAGRPAGGDSLIIARTFQARARALPRGETAATTAANYARYWAGLAADKLAETDPRRLEAVKLRELLRP